VYQPPVPHHRGHDGRAPGPDRRKLDDHRRGPRGLSPNLTARIQRFGVYATDEIALTPDAYDARLGVNLDLPAPDHLVSRTAE
jgi:hypothetical protein